MALALSALLPAGFWEKFEYVAAYFAGKGSGSDSVAAEARVAVRIVEGKDGLILFDVGANKGDWGADMIRTLGPAVTKLYEFEPAPHNIKILRDRFSDTRISVVPSAVSDHEGKTELFSDVPGSGMASLYNRRLGHAHISLNEKTSISTVTLDRFIEESGIKRVDFMKMDIEGAEFSALKGAERSLARGIISAFSFEFGGGNIDSRTYFQDFWYLLRPLGFNISRIVPGGSLLPIRRYSEMLESFRTTNYVATLAK
jgi:FkbM family methyltransferase